MAEHFDPATLHALAESVEIDITPTSSGTPVTIWTVRVDDDVYVRSFRGERGRWYLAFREEPQASLIYSGGELQVRGEPVADRGLNESIDAAYLEKYRTSQYAGSMVTPEVALTTMRLLPV
jgi:hypothetical protein